MINDFQGLDGFVLKEMGLVINPQPVFSCWDAVFSFLRWQVLIIPGFFVTLVQNNTNTTEVTML